MPAKLILMSNLEAVVGKASKKQEEEKNFVDESESCHDFQEIGTQTQETQHRGRLLNTINVRREKRTQYYCYTRVPCSGPRQSNKQKNTKNTEKQIKKAV